MRAALCFLLLGSTALLAGCVEDGPSRTSLRYDDSDLYSRRSYPQRTRDDTYRVREYNEDNDGSGRYDRRDRGDRAYRLDREDAPGRYDRRDRNSVILYDEQDDSGYRRERCVYPCIR